MEAKTYIQQEKRRTVENAELLKAVAHPVRLCLVHQLARYGPLSVTFFTDCLEQSQSNISQHLSKLRAAGIVEATREGQSMVYELINDQVRDVIELLWKDKE